jgi:hypothetical protein
MNEYSFSPLGYTKSEAKARKEEADEEKLL